MLRFIILLAGFACPILSIAQEPTINQIYAEIQAGNLDRAQVMMQQVLVAHPGSAKAQFVQSELFARQGNLTKARESFNTAERLSPGLPFAKPEAVQVLQNQLNASDPKQLDVSLSTNAQSVRALYGSAKSPKYSQFLSSLRKAQSLEKLAAGLSAGIRLPRPITLSATECGTVNAFYRRQDRTLVLCLELIQHISEGVTKDRVRQGATEQDINRTASGALTFILMHEMGHALIHNLSLPILGRRKCDRLKTQQSNGGAGFGPI